MTIFFLRRRPNPPAFDDADEGLLDSELASQDPIGAWLTRYLTPAED
jgi:hypothetical protein